MNSRDQQLTWAKQRALMYVGVGRFADAVAGLRADLDKGAMSSELAMRGYKAAMDAALGRGSQALTGWIEGLRLGIPETKGRRWNIGQSALSERGPVWVIDLTRRILRSTMHKSADGSAFSGRRAIPELIHVRPGAE